MNKIKLIENSDFYINSKCCLLLTYMNIKQGSIISMCSESKINQSGYNELTKKQLKEKINLFKVLNLKYKEIKEIESCCISRTNNVLCDLTGKDRLKFGLALGYPKTAVLAFHNNIKQLNDNKYVQLCKNYKFIDHIGFVMSEVNWQSELEVIINWAEKIKEVSPKLYHKIS